MSLAGQGPSTEERMMLNTKGGDQEAPTLKTQGQSGAGPLLVKGSEAQPLIEMARVRGAHLLEKAEWKLIKMDIVTALRKLARAL